MTELRAELELVRARDEALRSRKAVRAALRGAKLGRRVLSAVERLWS